MNETKPDALNTNLPAMSIEVFDEVELWDDDMFAVAHEGAADALLDEYVRNEADQQARDELAAKALNLITSAAESPFNDASRKLDLINQLVSRIGAMCDHNHIQGVLEKHFPENGTRQQDREDPEADADDNEHPRRAKEKRSWISLVRSAGGIALRPLFGGLRKMLRTGG